MICVGLIVMKCFLPEPTPTDSFCFTYQKIIQEKGDSAITAPLNVKKRILANELFYKRTCGGLK